MERIRLIRKLMALLVLLLVPGCSPSVQPDRVHLPAGTVRLDGDPWAGYAYFRDPRFLQPGVDYKYDTELDQAIRARKMVEGEINFLVTTIDQVQANRPNGRIVGVIDESLGADALVLNTKKHGYLTRVDALPRLVEECRQEGRKPVLAYTGNSPSDFLLRKLSNTREELRLLDYELKSVDQSSTAYKMLQDNTADVAVLWEPDTTAAAKAGYTVALSSKDVPHSIVDVLVASNRVVAEQPSLVQKVVDGLYKARRDALADPAAFTAYIAKDGQLENEQAAQLLKGIHLFDLREANDFMNKTTAPLDQTPAFEALESISALLSLNDPTIVASPDLLDGRFVAAHP
ncbi:MAG TPA: hypothetical protein VGO93_17865 [Candidatus Xenobia bacterium]|jgi:ABC-type nitrate/sulfonate/bicarbonate transport system substrate-binding protein